MIRSTTVVMIAALVAAFVVGALVAGGQNAAVAQEEGQDQQVDIKALTQAMRLHRLMPSLIKSAINSFSPDAALLKEAISGSADSLAFRATNRGATVKLGHVAGSCIFDPDSIKIPADKLWIARYEGEKFHRHASGHNPILQALMAEHGFNIDAQKA